MSVLIKVIDMVYRITFGIRRHCERLKGAWQSQVRSRTTRTEITTSLTLLVMTNLRAILVTAFFNTQGDTGR